MNNIIKFDGHMAVISFDPDIEMFRVEFIVLNGGTDCYAYSVQELKTEGAESLKFFLETCSKKGIEPYKSYSGKSLPACHRKTMQRWNVLRRQAGESINQLLNQGEKMLIKQRES